MATLQAEVEKAHYLYESGQSLEIYRDVDGNVQMGIQGAVEEFQQQPTVAAQDTGTEDQLNPFATAGEVTPMGVGEFAQKTATTLGGAAAGAGAVTIGIPGDLIALGEGLYSAASAEDGQKLDSFLETVATRSEQIGSEAVLGELRTLVAQSGLPPEMQQNILSGSRYLGEWGEIPGGITAAVKILKGAKAYAAGAPARVAERGTGTTLQSGIDPMAAVDEAIAGLKSKAAKAPTDEEEGFIAFSGSPSDFNQFSLSKIGTGEGNQQFGYGLYFSDVEDIARFYRDALSDRQPISLDDLDTDAPAIIANINVSPSDQPNMGFLKESDPDFDEYMQMIDDNAVSKNSSPLTGGFTDYEMKDGSVIRVSEGPDDALQETDPRVVIQALGEPTGKIYKVKINAIKNELVDQTKPLGKQPKKVKDALSDIGDNLTLDDALNLGFDPFELGEQQALQKAKEMLLDPESDVLSFLSNMQSLRGSANAGEKALSDRGVKGMRYLTGAARQRRPIKAEQNYVIFDDKIIDILEKYGIVGPVAVSSVVASQSDQEQGKAQ